MPSTCVWTKSLPKNKRTQSRTTARAKGNNRMQNRFRKFIRRGEGQMFCIGIAQTGRARSLKPFVDSESVFFAKVRLFCIHPNDAP